jgi:hypothetical protein
LRLDLIALLRAHKPEHPLTLQYRGLELMANPVLERLVTPNPVDALGEASWLVQAREGSTVRS